MSDRRPLVALAIAITLGASTLVATNASARAPEPWSPPVRIPGTAGLANPQSAVAPDGTDLVTWGVPDGGTRNAMVGKVRLPGETKWKRLPKGPSGDYLSTTGFAPTPTGDFWMTYVTGAGNYKSYLVKLDAQTRRWSKPIRLFQDQKAYYHGAPQLGLAADGTLVVAAWCPPKVDPGGDPVYRIAVGVHSPGGQWKNRFVSAAGEFTNLHQLAINAAGDAVVAFTQGYQLADMTVRAVTKAHGKHSKWKVSTLSVAGDSQRVHASIGADGTAAVVWSATSQSFNAIRMSTRDVRDKLDPWVKRDLVTGAPIDTNAYDVVDRHGNVTAVWRQSAVGGTTAIWSRYLDNTGLSSPVQLTPNGEIAEFDGLVQLPNGKAALLYQRFTPTIDSLAMEFRTLKYGVSGPAQTLLGDEATDGNANSEFLGMDAASRGTMIYTRGDYPDTDFAWLSQTKAPSVMTGPTSGKTVKHAHVSGSLHVGTKATCDSGYWVEASGLDYRWERNGHRIAGATSKHYRLVEQDNHERISCGVTGHDDSGHKRVLTSPPRRAG